MALHRLFFFFFLDYSQLSDRSRRSVCEETLSVLRETRTHSVVIYMNSPSTGLSRSLSALEVLRVSTHAAGTGVQAGVISLGADPALTQLQSTQTMQIAICRVSPELDAVKLSIFKPAALARARPVHKQASSQKKKHYKSLRCCCFGLKVPLPPSPKKEN